MHMSVPQKAEESVRPLGIEVTGHSELRYMNAGNQIQDFIAEPSLPTVLFVSTSDPLEDLRWGSICLVT